MKKSYHDYFKPSDHSKYDNLIYFRWKALIRSPQYLSFYFSRAADIDELIDFEDTNATTKNEILAEANNKFGLIVSDITDLEPSERPMKFLYVTFRDYIANIPSEDLTTMFTGIVESTDTVREVKQDELAGLEPYFTRGDFRLFLVNAHASKSLILKSFKRYLNEQLITKSERKDFDSWKEAFEIWDINNELKNKGTKNHLLSTADKMRKKYPNNSLWQLNHLNKSTQNIKTRVSDKLKIARALIDLAGNGQFKTL